MKRLLPLLLIVALVGAGCGSKSSSSSSSSSANGATDTSGAAQTTTAPKTHFAKTKFVIHAGLAFGAFHRYIYKPFKAGKLRGNPLTHKLAYLKAAAAGAFTIHELKLAEKDAQSSPLLKKLISPITALQTKLGLAVPGIKKGKVDGAALDGANADAAGISKASAAAGQPVTDQPTPSLGG